MICGFCLFFRLGETEGVESVAWRILEIGKTKKSELMEQKLRERAEWRDLAEGYDDADRRKGKRVGESKESVF